MMLIMYRDFVELEEPITIEMEDTLAAITSHTITSPHLQERDSEWREGNAIEDRRQ